MKRIRLDAIEIDTSIQCRAAISPEVVSDYAEAMQEGASFPDVILFGKPDRCWPGDGWHRIMAARQIGYTEIDADLRPGGRAEALKHALTANAIQGQRRTNADKRRAVEIALREFPDLSSRAIAELCAVSNHMVERIRPDEQVGQNPTSTVTGADGKQYPAKRTPPVTDPDDIPGFRESDGEPEQEEEVSKERMPTLGPPRNGISFARIALMKLNEIQPNDLQRKQAMELIREWLDENDV